MPIAAGPRLDRLAVGAFHRRVLFLIGAGLFLDSVDLSLGANVLSALLATGWSTLGLNAAFVSSTFAGMLLGAATAGWVADQYGRRCAFQSTLLVFGLASILAGFSPNMQWLIGLRFLMGVGLGAEVVIGYSMMSELMPAHARGRWVALLFILTNTGVPAASLLALGLIPTLGWRTTFILVGILGCLLWSQRKSMPESPRWLESRGRLAEAEQVLTGIEAAYSNLPPPRAVAVSAVPDRPMPIRVLLTPNVLPRTAVAVVFYIAQGSCAYGLVGWLPTFLVQQGHGIVASLSFTTLMNLGAPCGGLLAFAFADRLGRRTCIIGGSILTAGLALIYAATHAPLLLTVVGFCLIAALYSWVAAGCALIPELFPTPYRFRAVGYSNMVGRLATALFQFGVVCLFAWGGIGAVVGPIAALLLVQALLIYRLVRETRGRSLEAIQQQAG